MKKINKRFIYIIIAIVVLAISLQYIKYCNENGGVDIQSDKKILVIIEEVKTNDVEDIFLLGLEEYEQENYKLAYNLFDLTVDKLEEEDVEIENEETLEEIGMVKMYMAVCFYGIHNYSEAMRLINESIDKYPGDESLNLQKKNIQSVIYSDYSTFYGFEKMKETETVIYELMDLSINNADLHIEKENIDRESKEVLARFYTLSPEIFNPQKAIEIYLSLIEERPDVTSYRYSLIHAYIQKNEYESVKREWDELRKLNISEVNNSVIGAMYFLGKEEPEKAEKYLEELKNNSKDDVSKIKYYYVATNYYIYLGNDEEAKIYLKKIIDVEVKEVFTQSFIELGKKLGMDFSEYRSNVVSEYKKRGNEDLKVR